MLDVGLFEKKFPRAGTRRSRGHWQKWHQEISLFTQNGLSKQIVWPEECVCFYQLWPFCLLRRTRDFNNSTISTYKQQQPECLTTNSFADTMQSFSFNFLIIYEIYDNLKFALIPGKCTLKFAFCHFGVARRHCHRFHFRRDSLPFACLDSGDHKFRSMKHII